MSKQFSPARYAGRASSNLPTEPAGSEHGKEYRTNQPLLRWEGARI